ncbi:MAG: NAD(P)-binding domain-containing protein [Candidatus Micrarchaeota archaeon]
MKIGILGTGPVGQAHAARLVGMGHDVMVGTRSPHKTIANKEKDAMGRGSFGTWYESNRKVKVGTFADCAMHGELLINATLGQHSIEALRSAGSEIDRKIVIDISNPLDFSKGMPPTLTVCNTDSLGEQIQKAFPKAKIVKSLNTLSAPLQVDPHLMAGGDHHIFVCGNDPEAKQEVISFLKREYGWENILDLGDIKSSRGVEMILPLWINLWGALKTPMFNFKLAMNEK